MSGLIEQSKISATKNATLDKAPSTDTIVRPDSSQLIESALLESNLSAELPTSSQLLQISHPIKHLSAGEKEQETKQRDAFYSESQKKLRTEKTQEAKNNPGIERPIPSASLNNLKDLHDNFQYLKEVRGTLKLDFPVDISILIAEYFSDQDNISQLLKYVVEGEQDKAEVLVKVYPELLLKKGTITDLSKREFKDTTAFQYALWALDWHMWKMLLNYMSKEDAAEQFAELEEKGTAHGKHFNLSPLIEVLNTYVKNHDAWYQAKAWDKLEDHWCRQVGGAQLLLPVHVVNEYCHPNRDFFPCPNFDELVLIRSRMIDKGEWFACSHNGGTLGVKFGILRGNDFSAGAAPNAPFSYTFYSHITAKVIAKILEVDTAALQSLWKMRQSQLEKLKTELTEHIKLAVVRR